LVIELYVDSPIVVASNEEGSLEDEVVILTGDTDQSDFTVFL
jgi:hypothetical protein